MVLEQRNGNGYDPAEEAVGEAVRGAQLKLSDLKRENGIFTRTATQHQSLLHRAISAINDNNDYRQELKVALWKTGMDEADEAVAALHECFALGMDPTPIIDQIIARSAGHNHELLYESLRTLTHSTFTTNYQNRNNKNANAGKNSLP